MKLAPSKEQLDQLLLHHILVKVQQLEDTQKELKEKNQILDKMSNLVQVIIKSTSQFDQLNTRLKAVESIMQSTQNRADEVIGLKGELENLRLVLDFMLPAEPDPGTLVRFERVPQNCTNLPGGRLFENH